MKLLEKEFDKNANQSGMHRFTQVKHETLSNGKNLYIYSRTNTDGKIVAYEVVFGLMKKAGTVERFPGGVTRTFEEDTEFYPTKSHFGTYAWFCVNLPQAEKQFAKVVGLSVECEETGEAVDTEEVKPKGKRGRPKVARPLLDIPEVEFSVTELATLNKVEYPVAFRFVKEAEEKGQVKRTRTEQRATKGKPTQLFAKN